MHKYKINIEYFIISMSRFADDIDLIAENKEDLI